VRSTIEDVAERLAVRAHERGLELVTLVEPSVPRVVRGDALRIQQILVNLVGNALKFTDHGEVVLSVSQVEELGHAHRLRFDVVDTGIGIPSDKVEHLFAAFSQVDTSVTRRHGGTGLGLAISKQLSELMGGGIGVESALGRGSRFWFTIEVEKAREAPRAPEGPLHHRRLCVLVPHAATRRSLVQILEELGARTDEAASARELPDVLRAAELSGEPVELVLVDASLPDAQLALVREILDLAAGAPSGVAITVLARNGGSSDLLRARFSRSIEKPFRRVRISKVLETVFAQRRGEVASSEDLSRWTGRVTMDAPSAVPVGAATGAHGSTAPSPQRETARADSERPPPPIGPTPASGPARILLVEDNGVNQMVAVHMLARLGYASDVAANGEEAIAALQRESYALVLMDCHMPVLDGFEATRRVRCGDAKVLDPAVPIVALTASALASDRDACFEAGMTDYVSKPIRLSDLEAVVTRWLTPQAARG
ncbi:ATP-binding protein, partial [Myxococcota bacterium]|nr:ATP-binding protein [Myxococcota bacterium]